VEKPKQPRFWIVFIYLIFLALAIPWYWPSNDMRHIYGLPLWVISTLMVLLTTSIFTAWVFLSGPENDDH
jgi:hypothetical protein